MTRQLTVDLDREWNAIYRQLWRPCAELVFAKTSPLIWNLPSLLIDSFPNLAGSAGSD